MIQKKAIISCLVSLCLLLYCSCLKREQSHPLDPGNPVGKTATPITPQITQTLTQIQVLTFTHTSVCSVTPTVTVTFTLEASHTAGDTSTVTHTQTDTLTLTKTPTPTPTSTATTVIPAAWLDRGENTTDICEPPGGCHQPMSAACSVMGNDESIVDAALYPRLMNTTGIVGALTTAGGSFNCTAAGAMSWQCNCVGTISPSGATCDISNYTGTAYAGGGCLRLSGSMKGYSWGGWAWQRMNVCGNWRPVDISAYAGISFYGMSLGGDPNLMVAIGEPMFDGGGFYSPDRQCPDDPLTPAVIEGCTHVSNVALGGDWALQEIPFAGMNSGWPSSFSILNCQCLPAVPGSCVSCDPIFSPGVELGPGGSGIYSYDSLIDELKFY